MQPKLRYSSQAKRSQLTPSQPRSPPRSQCLSVAAPAALQPADRFARTAALPLGLRTHFSVAAAHYWRSGAGACIASRRPEPGQPRGENAAPPFAANSVPAAMTALSPKSFNDLPHPFPVRPLLFGLVAKACDFRHCHRCLLYRGRRSRQKRASQRLRIIANSYTEFRRRFSRLRESVFVKLRRPQLPGVSSVKLQVLPGTHLWFDFRNAEFRCTYSRALLRRERSLVRSCTSLSLAERRSLPFPKNYQRRGADPRD